MYFYCIALHTLPDIFLVCCASIAPFEGLVTCMFVCVYVCVCAFLLRFCYFILHNSILYISNNMGDGLIPFWQPANCTY